MNKIINEEALREDVSVSPLDIVIAMQELSRELKKCGLNVGEMLSVESIEANLSILNYAFCAD